MACDSKLSGWMVSLPRSLLPKTSDESLSPMFTVSKTICPATASDKHNTKNGNIKVGTAIYIYNVARPSQVREHEKNYGLTYSSSCE